MAESPLLSPASASAFDLEGARVWVAGHRYFRPTEVDLLVGNPAKARDKLGWRHRTTFPDLVKKMVAHDLGQAQQQPAGPGGA